jgi:hypothetical protein
MVFFSSCMSVKFHHELLNYIDLPVMCIHGKQKQTKRTTTFFQFCNADSGILLCTDVAARGELSSSATWTLASCSVHTWPQEVSFLVLQRGLWHPALYTRGRKR